jgi:hypothetical protein
VASDNDVALNGCLTAKTTSIDQAAFVFVALFDRVDQTGGVTETKQYVF